VIPGKTYTPDELAGILWKGRWIVLLCFVLGSAAAAGIAWYLPNQYMSDTLVLIIPQRVPENYVQNTVTTRIEDRITSLREQILARSRLERIIEEFNLYPEARKSLPMEDIIASMKPKVITRVVRGDAFTVSFIGDSPELAQKVTERLSTLFIEENMRDRTVIAESTNQFLRTQLDAALQQLTESERSVEVYRRRYAGELPDQAASNLSAIQNSESQIQSLTESLNRDRDRRLQLERQIAEASTPEAEAAPAPLPQLPRAANTPLTPEQELEAADANLRSLQTKLPARHPDIVRARGTVERLRAQVAAQRQAAPGPGNTTPAPRLTATEIARRNRLNALTAELQVLITQIQQKEANEERLRSTAQMYRARLEAAPIRQTELIALTRDYDTLQRQYQDLLKKYEDSKVAANMERRQISEQFRVLDPPRVPEQAYTPNRFLIRAAGAVFGLGLGIALVGLREFLNRSLRTASDVVACLDLPVLAALPMVGDPPKRGWWWRSRGATAAP
jgi:polysaccharide chain length determinant protein (PEP-CTERM system associated)